MFETAGHRTDLTGRSHMVKRKGDIGLSASFHFHCHRIAHNHASVKPWSFAAPAFGVACSGLSIHEMTDTSPRSYSDRTDLADRSGTTGELAYARYSSRALVTRVTAAAADLDRSGEGRELSVPTK